MCVTLGQYQQGIDHFKRALEIQQQYLLPTNPAFAKTYDHIAHAYNKMENFEE